MATWPRRIVALSVGVVLLVGLATASVASARSTLVWTGGNSARPNEPFTRFTTATGSKYRNDLNELVPGVDKRDILPSTMSQYKCVMLWLNATPPAAFDTLNNYMLNGGTVVAVGEYGPDYAPVDAGINAIATGLGSTMQLKANKLAMPQTTTNLAVGNPYMTDVQEIFYGVASSMTLGTGGTSLVRDNLLMEPIIGIENRGAGRFVLIGDSNVFSDEIAAAYDPGRNGVFARNLCGDNVPPTVTITRPAKNARYKLGASLGSIYSCADDDETGPPSCDATPAVAVGDPFDTSTGGPKSFRVDAFDVSGNHAFDTNLYFVDDSPPDVVFRTPIDGGDYDRGSSLTSDFDCVDEDGPGDIDTAKTIATYPDGNVINTTAVSPVGGFAFTVTCFDLVGNTSTKTIHYTITDRSPPAITSTMPLDDNTTRLRLNQSIASLYACTDADGPADILFCGNTSLGDVALGQPVPTGVAGNHTFPIHASDLSGNPANINPSYFVDASPPAINIRVPAQNGRYNKGTQLIADFDCTDPDDTADPFFQDVLTCQGPVGDGQPIDTSAAGPRTFKVDATDRAGNAATKSVAYTILGTAPPTVTITSPVDGAVFKQGAAIVASYSCSDPDGPADIKLCKADSAVPIDSSKAGTFKFTARAQDFADNIATKTHSYTITGTGSPSSSAAPTKTTATTKTCKSRRSFTVRVKKKKGVRIVGATVTVNGKKQKAKKGKRFTGKVNLVGLKKGRYVVVIKVKLSNGKTVTDTRRFKTCTPKGK